MMARKRYDITIDEDLGTRMKDAAFKKYGNSRSFSTLIEDLFKAMNNRPIADIEAIKAAREEYAKELNQDMDKLFFSVEDYKSACGAGAFRDYRCKTCGAEFETMVKDAKYCPSCQQSDLYLFPPEIPYDEIMQMLKKRTSEDAWGDGAKERIGKKVLNYILDELKNGQEPSLSEVVENFDSTSEIVAKILSPLRIKPKQKKFTQDMRSQIEEILDHPWVFGVPEWKDL